MPQPEEIRQNNSDALKAAINTLDVINYETAAKLIPGMLTEGKLTLNTSAYLPADPTDIAGIGRYLIYNHDSETEPFSIWAFALAPKQKTSIHDHKYAGTVTVLEGPVSEKYYRPTDGDAAQRIGQADRYKFHTNTDNLTDDFVHRLKRRKGLGEGISVTLHTYNMPAHLITEDGETITRRNLSRFFTKDKSLPPYKDKGVYQELKAAPLC